MSWSVQLFGTPEGVNKALDEHGDAMTDSQSKTEFLNAKPHLQGLVAQAVGPAIRLNANGSGTFTDGVKTYGNIAVSLECFYGKWCE